MRHERQTLLSMWAPSRSTWPVPNRAWPRIFRATISIGATVFCRKKSALSALCVLRRDLALDRYLRSDLDHRPARNLETVGGVVGGPRQSYEHVVLPAGHAGMDGRFEGAARDRKLRHQLAAEELCVPDSWRRPTARCGSCSRPSLERVKGASSSAFLTA